MRKIIGLVALMFMSNFMLFGQEKTEKEKTPEQKALEESFRRSAAKYQTALRYNDMGVAKDAVYEMLILNPRGVNMLDTLALLYFENNQFTSAILVSNDAISVNPNNADMLEINALSYEAIGLKKDALEKFETLYLKTDDLGVLFKMATLQFDLKRFNECKTSIEILLDSKGIDEGYVSFPHNGQTYSTSWRAGGHYLLGLVHVQRGKKDDAKASFSKAMEIDGDFLPAKDKLVELGN